MLTTNRIMEIPELTVWFARHLNPQAPTFYSRNPNAVATENDKMYYELTMWVDDADIGEWLEKNGIPVKNVKSGKNQGKKYISLKRNVKKANGEVNGAVKCFNPDNSPVTDFMAIGEHSKASMKVYQMPNSMAASGVFNSLDTVHFTSLVPPTLKEETVSYPGSAPASNNADPAETTVSYQAPAKQDASAEQPPF